MEGVVLLILLVVYVTVKVLLYKDDDRVTKDAKTYRVGIDLVRRKKYDEAFTYFNRVIQDNPKSALAYAYRGKCNLLMGDLYAAIYDCTEATSYDHCLAEAYLNKGIALYKLESYKDAFLEFDKATWHFRNNGVAFRWRAFTRIQLGMTDGKAEKDLKRAVELGDEDANYFLLNRGRVDINSLLK